MSTLDRIRPDVCATVVFSSLLMAGSPSFAAGNIQKSCDVDNGGRLHLEMSNTPELFGNTRALAWELELRPNQFVIQSPPRPQFRAWNFLDRIVFKTKADQSDFGTLVFVVRDGSRRGFPEAIGTVQRSCWATIQKYVHEYVERAGVVVPMREETGK